MSGVSKSRVVWVGGREGGLGGYQPGVYMYVPLKALFIVIVYVIGCIAHFMSP